MTSKLLIHVAALILIAACDASSGLAEDVRYGHVPLRYRGPDPTSGYFLPSTAIPPNGVNLTRLPPAAEQTPEMLPLPPGAFEQYPGTEEPWLQAPPVAAQHITDHKDGFFQKINFQGTYIDRNKATDFGINELNLSLSVALPAPKREWPMLITPAFNVRYLDGPLSPDLPPRLYESYVDFLWLPRLSQRWTGIIGVAPSYYGDFEVGTADAFRWTGKGLARYDWVPDRVQLVFGLLYLNRDDIRVLPAGGVIWVPSDSRRYELVFPRPKLAHRIDVGPGYEDWLYLGGEFGGNTFAIERLGLADKITLRDYRILLGLERKLNGGAGYRLEIGYVMGRRIEFASGLPDAVAGNTALVRGGVTY